MVWHFTKLSILQALRDPHKTPRETDVSRGLCTEETEAQKLRK